MEHRVYLIENSQQLVLDILNVKNPLKGQRPKNPHGFLERVQSHELAMTAYDRSASMGQTFARLTFELKQPATYAIRVAPGRIELGIRPKESETPTDEATETNEISEPGEAGSAASTTDPAIPENFQIEPEGVNPILFFGVVPGESEEYQIGPEDVLELGVFELDQLNRTVRVESDGNVILPLIGAVNVRGLSARQAADRVAGRLRNGFVDDPQVTVLIKEYHSRKVSLLGAVSRPAAYPLVGQRNLLQLLTEAGGLSTEAGGVLYIFRQLPGGKNARLTVPLNELLIQGDPLWNIGLLPGDVVSVPPEEAISVSVVGAVNSPGVYKLPVGQGATLLRLIALSGGLRDRASKDLQIKRYASSGEEILLKVDLGDILSGKSPDVQLQEGDVVVVKQSFF
jgi:polysaccharide export outer membrane protein